jgi:hypothetical protein
VIAAQQDLQMSKEMVDILARQEKWKEQGERAYEQSLKGGGDQIKEEKDGRRWGFGKENAGNANTIDEYGSASEQPIHLEDAVSASPFAEWHDFMSYNCSIEPH